MTNKMTVETYLMKAPDAELLHVQEELLTGIVPATGYAHGLVRKINHMIDAGQCCINPTTYRKVYLPTLAKALQRELARRYVECRLHGLMDYPEV